MKIIEYEYSFIYLFTAASRSCPGSKKAFPRRARKKEVTKEAPAKDTLVMIMTPLIMIIMMIVMLIIMIMMIVILIIMIMMIVMLIIMTMTCASGMPR